MGSRIISNNVSDQNGRLSSGMMLDEIPREKASITVTSDEYMSIVIIQVEARLI